MDIPIFTKLYDFYKNLTQMITKFPKTRRYTLGQKLDSLTLEIFEILFSIPHSSDKENAIWQISGKIDLLKVLLRISKDTQALNNRSYLELQASLQEIGRMTGGWLKSFKNPRETIATTEP